MTADGGSVIVRDARPHDLDAVVAMIREHAVFERAAPPSPGVHERLGALLFGSESRLFALVADGGDGLIGYATASLEVSTWRAAEYLHMDCLFVREAARGDGVGAHLLEGVRGLAGGLGVDRIEWQTPEWNDGAARFYDRVGAVGLSKRRYSLGVAMA